MSEIKKLLSLCKCGVYITINKHRDYYETIESHLSDQEPIFDENIESEKLIKEKVIQTDTLVEIQFYPRTPVWFYTVYHYDIEEAIKLALMCPEFRIKES